MNSPEKMEKKIIIASARGFCAGVIRAIHTVEQALKIFDHPLYVHHQIVHNKYVVEDLEKRGVRFIEELDEMPDNLPVIFSAHGVSPEVHKKAAQKNLQVIDATCPLVAKVHTEAIRYSKNGYRIFYIGHNNHPETKGTYGEAPEAITVIENEAQADQLMATKDKAAVLTQTTLSIYDTEKVITSLKQKFPDLATPKKSDICFATTNRQESVLTLSNNCDLVFILGSKNSSNSNRLKEVAFSQNTPSYLIDGPEDIETEWLLNAQTVGITAGASAPEFLVTKTIEFLKEKFGFKNVEYRNIKEENISFQLPEELQKLLTKAQ
ncbi:MAG: 4-hydroxy-3-methylbut-2-enyl diphosphate reductase [Leptospirales bacterium]